MKKWPEDRIYAARVDLSEVPILRNGVGMFRYTRFEGATRLSHIDSRARTASNAVNFEFLALRNNVFKMEKQIFGNIDGVESWR